MTADEQGRLASDLDGQVRHLRSCYLDGMPLLGAMSGRMADLKALMDAAGPNGMVSLAKRMPNLGHLAGLLAGLPRGGPAGLYR